MTNRRVGVNGARCRRNIWPILWGRRVRNRTKNQMIMNGRTRDRSRQRRNTSMTKGKNRRRKGPSLSKDRLLLVTDWESVSLPLLCPSLSLCNALLKSD